MNIVAKTLQIVATLTSESTSTFGFYDPKMPKKLVKTEKDKQQVRHNVQIFCRKYCIPIDKK